MKVAIITDTHFGVRNDSIHFLNNTKVFLDNIFFPYLEDTGIKTVIHLGDLVDRRKYINFNTANRLRTDFLDVLHKKNIDCYFIAGNHDTTYKNTNDLNALRELLYKKYTFKIYDKQPEEVTFDGTPILFIPWICDENRELSIQLIGSSNAKISMGHLEIQGFEMYKGSPSLHGDDPRIFDRFDVVCSGHYHHRSNNNNIFYLGSHGEFTWSDYDDPRGFHVFDTETHEIKFIQNTYIMFKKIWYDDNNIDLETLLNVDFESCREKLIKVIINNRTNPYYFDRFIECLEKVNVVDMQIVDDHLNLNNENDESIISEAESTIDIFKKYIAVTEMKSVSKDKIQKMIETLYSEALSLEK